MGVVFLLSVASLTAWLAARFYLNSLTDALALELRRVPTDSIELMRLGELIQGTTVVVEVTFLLFAFLLVLAVGFLIYMFGEGPRDPEELARDKLEKAQEELEAAIEARHQREADEGEERP